MVCVIPLAQAFDKLSTAQWIASPRLNAASLMTGQY